MVSINSRWRSVASLWSPLFMLLAAIAVAFPAWAASGINQDLHVQHYPDTMLPTAKDSINLVSLNLAHGRKTNVSQILTSKEQIEKNLTLVSQFLVDVDADIVALQEADLPSWWSGDFDHISYIAHRTGHYQSAHTSHVQSWFGQYGTAVLSKHEIYYAEGVTFSPSFPTTRKGFTLIEVKWETTNGPVMLDVVSLHMDFLREAVRKQQLQELTNVLIDRGNPLAIMGDFNSADIAKRLVSSSIEHHLHTYQADTGNLNTYNSKRLDWIILSDDLMFNQFTVSPLVMSDHKAIVANISLAPL